MTCRGFHYCGLCDDCPFIDDCTNEPKPICSCGSSKVVGGPGTFGHELSCLDCKANWAQAL